MARYSISNTLAGSQQGLTPAFQTIVTLTAAAPSLCRAWIYDILVSADAGVGVNSQVIFDWSRQTAPGTATAATPNPIDGADTAAGTSGAVNATAEGTIAPESSLLSLALNARTSRRWVARDERAAIVLPATNLVAIAARARSPNYSSTVVITEMFSE